MAVFEWSRNRWKAQMNFEWFESVQLHIHKNSSCVATVGPGLESTVIIIIQAMNIF